MLASKRINDLSKYVTNSGCIGQPLAFRAIHTARSLMTGEALNTQSTKSIFSAVQSQAADAYASRQHTLIAAASDDRAFEARP